MGFNTMFAGRLPCSITLRLGFTEEGQITNELGHTDLGVKEDPRLMTLLTLGLWPDTGGKMRGWSMPWKRN